MAAINGEESRCMTVFHVYVLTRGCVDSRTWNKTVIPGREAEGNVGGK
jgi:hypothetical protein